MPAIDLSAIGKTCGRKIDGILGVDLLGKLGASINLKDQTIHVATTDEAHGAEMVSGDAARNAPLRGGVQRFRRREIWRLPRPERSCCSSTRYRTLRPRTSVGYFRQRYFHQQPSAKLEILESAFHPIGEAVWYEYEFTIDSARGKLHGRGMAMCKKSDGQWRMASMHHSIASWNPPHFRGKSVKPLDRAPPAEASPS